MFAEKGIGKLRDGRIGMRTNRDSVNNCVIFFFLNFIYTVPLYIQREGSIATPVITH